MHHANLLIGDTNWALSQIAEQDRTPGLDVSIYSYERMSIQNVRSLIEEVQLRPVTSAYRSFVLFTNDITIEAQNALLKIFEEPNATTVFYLTVPREDMLLKTLRSRLQIYARQGSDESTEELQIFTMFQKAGYAERLAMIAERLTAEDTQWITSLTRGIEHYAHTTRNAALMDAILKLLSRVHAPGSSKKMLLEHIALSL